MARPPKYTDADKPVSVSLRIPRDIYDQAQHLAQIRRTSLTEVVLEGLRQRLEMPVSSMPLVPYDDHTTVIQELTRLLDARIQTVIQELDVMIDIRLSTALAALSEAPIPPVPALLHNDTITVMQDRETILAQIHTWRQDGRSYEAIARQLNADGIPTFSGKGTWSKGTIQKQLQKHT
jgi:recombinase